MIDASVSVGSVALRNPIMTASGTAGYGDESSVQRRHACNGVHVELDEACLKAFDLAVADIGLWGEPARRVSAYFRRATVDQRRWGAAGTTVPDGLPFNYA